MGQPVTEFAGFLSMRTILVTGGVGFIGSNFILKACRERWPFNIINLDNLTYATHPQTLVDLNADSMHHFIQGDVGDVDLVKAILLKHQPTAVINFAAETHVDRSIDSPHRFIQTNIVGTSNLLESTRQYWQTLSERQKSEFRFLQISTDEVYGSLKTGAPPSDESSPYAPNSPYAASKASADHLVRAYHQTYGLPTLTTHSSNNYGPRQFPEKLIPLIILNALAGKPLPIYGDGQNIRDWLHVDDHCRAIQLVLDQGRVGEQYNIGGDNQITNIALVTQICGILDELLPKPNFTYSSLITFVPDRLGHDYRYAIDCSKIQRELGWKAKVDFETGLLKTVRWYLGELYFRSNRVEGKNLMTAQIFQPQIVTEDMLEALRRLSPVQYRQVVDFARFLGQERSVEELQHFDENGNAAHEENWVDRISGSFKDDSGFEEVLQYGREYRQLTDLNGDQAESP
jgi:dTDP-glucose 4,6-dehydratase